MGLIQIAKDSIKGTLSDQWKEAIRCENLGEDVLMKRVTAPNGIISNKSIIVVDPGQCAVIVDNGKVIDATAEDGPYVFDESSTPSFFAGQFGDVFKEMWNRFTFKGQSSKEQAVYFFNTKEITQNTFGTQVPMLYQDWGHTYMNRHNGKETPLTVKVKCFGNYTFKISNPALFMNEIAGTESVYKTEAITGQIKAEVTHAFENVLNELGNSQRRVPVAELQSNSNLIREIMNDKVLDEPIRRRGMTLLGFTIGTVSLDEKSQESIEKYEAMGDEYLEKNRYYDVFTGNNSNGGNSAGANPTDAMMTMMAMNMMQNNMQNMNGQNNSQPQQTQNSQAPQANQVNGWECPNCKNVATGNFCTNCGTKKPEAKSAKFCPKCGAKVDEGSKFCPECGEKVE